MCTNIEFSDSELAEELLRLDRDFTAYLLDESDLESQVQTWETVATILERRKEKGGLRPSLARLAGRVAQRVACLGSSVRSLAAESDRDVVKLTVHLDDLMGTASCASGLCESMLTTQCGGVGPQKLLNEIQNGHALVPRTQSIRLKVKSVP
jgi:hypothetical protein